MLITMFIYFVTHGRDGQAFKLNFKVHKCTIQNVDMYTYVDKYNSNLL